MSEALRVVCMACHGETAWCTLGSYEELSDLLFQHRAYRRTQNV